ncbi:MAG: shikimate kinase, partial [Haliscomenobacter sp.]
MALPARIYLLGYMGSGKSFSGKRLARQLDRPFIDLDDYIE